MANALCFISVNCIESPARPPTVRHHSVLSRNAHTSSRHPSSIPCPKHGVRCTQNPVSHTLTAKATGSNQNTMPNSIVCADCEGNGAVQCSQCEGTGVNSVDHFNGQFKAGALCWLCRGKREILCGNCNGAGFLGGFMSTFDE